MHFTKTMFQKRNFKKRVDIFRQQAYLECKLLQNRNSQTNNPHFEETVTFLKHLYPIHIIYCFCNLRLSQQRGEILTLKTYLKIHPDDLVAVALAPLSAGTVVEIQDQTVTLKEDIPQGHKFALADIRAGSLLSSMVLQSELQKKDIPCGAWVHTHNIKTGLGIFLRTPTSQTACRYPDE